MLHATKCPGLKIRYMKKFEGKQFEAKKGGISFELFLELW